MTLLNNPKSNPGLISTDRSHCRSGFEMFNELKPVTVEPSITALLEANSAKYG